MDNHLPDDVRPQLSRKVLTTLDDHASIKDPCFLGTCRIARAILAAVEQCELKRIGLCLLRKSEAMALVRSVQRIAVDMVCRIGSAGGGW